MPTIVDAPLSGLVGHWPLQSHSQDALRTFNGTDTSVTYDGESAAYNGSSSKIQVANSLFSPFRQSAEITYSFWAKFNSGSGGTVHMGTATSGGQGSGGISITQAGTLTFAWTPTNPAADRTWIATIPTVDTGWHHYAFTISFSGGSTGIWYVDGVAQATSRSASVTDGTPTTSYNTTNGDCIGARYVNSFSYGNANLAEVLVYSRALLPIEIYYLAAKAVLNVVINNDDMNSIVLWKTLSWKPAVTSKVDTLSFQVYKHGSRTYKPEPFDDILLYDQGVLVFGGTVVQITESIDAVERQTFQITCKDRTHELDRRLVAERYTSKPLINIICDILNRYVNKGSRIEIASFETNEIWQGDGTVDTTNYRIGDQARKLTSVNTATAQMWRDLKVDLSPTGYTNSDYIELDIYVDDVAKLGNLDIYLVHPNYTDYFTKDITAFITKSGWNFVSVPRSSFTSSGTPSWSNIGRVQVVVNSVASQTVNVTVDNWQEVKTTAFTRHNSNNALQIVKYASCNYEEPSKIFQKLADLFQWQWYVDANRDIHFFGRFANPSPFNITDTNGKYIYNSLVVNRDADQIRNGIFVRGGDYLAASINEDLKHQANSVNKIFKLGYKYASYSLTLDGVAQAIGIDNINAYTDNNGAYQSQTGTDISLGDAAARTKQSQQVIVTASGKRSKVTLRIKKVGSPADNFQVQIFSDSSNAPSGTNLSTIATLAGGTITTSYVEYTFALTAAGAGLLTLTQPTTYHVVCSRSGANDGSNYYQIDGVAISTYEGFPKTHNGTSWSTAAANMYFTEKIDFDVLYSFNEKVATFNTAPAAASTITWSGQPYLPIIIRFNDPDSVAQYGVFEYKITDPTIRTQEGAKQRAQAELTNYAQTLQDVRFTTYSPGLYVGQTINIQSDIRDLDLDLIIISITAKARTPFTMEYQVTCALTKSLGMIYWMQDQLMKESNQVIVDDNEVFDRSEYITEEVHAVVDWDYEIFVGHVYSNDAGTTPNAGVWSGGSSHIYV